MTRKHVVQCQSVAILYLVQYSNVCFLQDIYDTTHTTMADAPGSPSHGTPLGEACPRCDLELVLLVNNNPGKGDFPACPGYPDTCAWTYIVLSWNKP